MNFNTLNINTISKTQVESKSILTHRSVKDSSIQAFRGIAITAVVLNHSIDSANTFHIKENFIQQNGISFLLAQSVTFAVPFFFFISGYFSCKKPINSFSEYIFYCRKKLSRILIPYFFWSFFVLITFDSMYGWNIQKIAVNLLIGYVQTPYYFLIAMAQLIILAPLLRRCTSHRFLNIAWMSVTPISLCLLYLNKFIIGYPLRFKFFAPLFLFWVSFYYLGILVSTNKDILRFVEQKKIWIFSLCLFLFFASSIEGLGTYFLTGGGLVSQMRLMTALFSAFFALGLFSIRRRVTSWPKLLVILGDYSFGIYLIHSMLLPSISQRLGNFSFLALNPVLYQLSIAVSVLLSCSLLVAMMRILFGNSPIKKYVGVC